MISLWSFITWSYSSRFLRIPKLLPSIFVCAFSIADVNILCWICSFSGTPNVLKISISFSEPNRRIRSSSREIKNWDSPGSPWRPERPRSWLSIRLDSWRSVPITFNPPASFASSSSLISVPRPAMLVAIVTAPCCPAAATISASSSWNFAFKTVCWIPSLFNIALIVSDTSIVIVPTSTGCPFACAAFTSSTTAWYFSFLVL